MGEPVAHGVIFTIVLTPEQLRNWRVGKDGISVPFPLPPPLHMAQPSLCDPNCPLLRSNHCLASRCIKNASVLEEPVKQGQKE